MGGSFIFIHGKTFRGRGLCCFGHSGGVCSRSRFHPGNSILGPCSVVQVEALYGELVDSHEGLFSCGSGLLRRSGLLKCELFDEGAHDFVIRGNGVGVGVSCSVFCSFCVSKTKAAQHRR